MKTRSIAKWSLFARLIGAGLIAGSTGGGRTATAAPDPLVVHEWGTFTSVAGADGSGVMWRPLTDLASDLPSFVRSTNDFSLPAGGGKGRMPGFVRMETPVLYFYADRTRDVSVRVDFPSGRITEWYPEVRSVGDHVDWGKVTIRPGTTPVLPNDGTASHYYPARDVDAAPLRVDGPLGPQDEKFLFYRGVARMEMPLSAKLEPGGTKVRLKSPHAVPVGRVILFERRGDKLGFSITAVGTTGEKLVARPALTATLGALTAELEAMLILDGLYPREAKAMIATWRDHWFEDGLRAIHLLPRFMTDGILPLHIEPAPTEVVRTMVNRVEIITPEMENVARTVVTTHRPGDAKSRATVAAALEGHYGRFARAVVERLRTSDPALTKKITDILAI